MNHSSFLSVALEATLRAEKIILHYYEHEMSSDLKADQSPVTIADQEAEQVIVDTIRSAFPEHRFLGEEYGETSGQSPYLWIIDPIDGTKNYLRKVPLFATQVALLYEGEVILGISNAPVLKELVYAERGKGASCNDQTIQVSQVDQLTDAYLSYGGLNLFDKHNLVEPLIALNHATLAHRGIGDFWSYHLLAQGKIDIMIEAETKIWDIAAVSLIVEEAGGVVTDLKGNRLTSDTTSIIATNSKLHPQVAEFFQH